jgi:hypothetical protein
MPSVLETPEVGYESSERSEMPAASQAASTSRRHGLSGLLDALRKTLTLRRQYQESKYSRQPEMPMDLLVRKYPHVYIYTAGC